jgi:hypothetical protein
VVGALQVQDASNPNQKEKYEGDLKKEIKKLQVRRYGYYSLVSDMGLLCRCDCSPAEIFHYSANFIHHSA